MNLSNAPSVSLVMRALSGCNVGGVGQMRVRCAPKVTQASCALLSAPSAAQVGTETGLSACKTVLQAIIKTKKRRVSVKIVLLQHIMMRKLARGAKIVPPVGHLEIAYHVTHATGQCNPNTGGICRSCDKDCFSMRKAKNIVYSVQPAILEFQQTHAFMQTWKVWARSGCPKRRFMLRMPRGAV